MYDLHPIQIQILKTLLFKPEARFSDLNQSELTNDHFTFHIRQLVKLGLISKSENKYELTDKGKELAGRIDTSTDSIVLQPKLGVAVAMFRGDEVLLNKRLKQQSLGQVGLHTEKVKIGEKLTDTVQRCVRKEIGDVDFRSEFAGVSHAQFINDELWLDVVLICFKCEYKSGEALPGNEEGENVWVKTSELDKVENLMSGIGDVIQKMRVEEKFFSE